MKNGIITLEVTLLSTTSEGINKSVFAFATQSVVYPASV